MSFLQELLTRVRFEVDDHALEGVHHKLEGIHRAVSVIATAEAGRALYELAERFSSLGEKLEASAIAAGISTDNLQKLQYAASQNAVGSDELSGALARLSRTLYAAQRGSKQAGENFGRIGITPAQLASFGNAEDAFYAVQDAINSNATTATQKIGLLQSFFGRGSARMVKFIAIGSDGTKKLGEDAAAMGAIISESGVKSLAELEDKVSGAGLVLRTFLASVGASLAPAFIQAIESIERSWMQNQRAIQAGMVTFARGTSYAFGVVYEAIRLVVASVARFVREHPALTEFGIKAYIACMVFSTGLEFLIKTLATGAQAVNALQTGIKLYGVTVTGLQTVLYKASIALGYFISFFSEKWGVKIAEFGTRLGTLAANPFLLQVGIYAAAIAGIVLAIQALYAMVFQGKAFGDTWLGQLLSGAFNLAKGLGTKVAGALGFDVSGKGPTGDTASRADFSAIANVLPMQNMMATADSMGISADPSRRFMGAAALAAPVAPAAVSVPAGAATISAPINVTVPAGTTQQQAIDIAARGAKKGLLDALNEANRGFANAQAY